MATAVFRVAPTPVVLREALKVLDPLDLLSAAELARMQRLRRLVDRDDFLAARALARLVGCHYLGQPATPRNLRAIDITQRCPTCNGTDHGAPNTSVPDLAVSWSHSAAVVAAAAGPAPIGIDLENPADAKNQPPEGDWVGWVRSEALIKIGSGDLDQRPTSAPPGVVLTQWRDEFGYGAVAASTTAERIA